MGYPIKGNITKTCPIYSRIQVTVVENANFGFYYSKEFNTIGRQLHLHVNWMVLGKVTVEVHQVSGALSQNVGPHHTNGSEKQAEKKI